MNNTDQNAAQNAEALRDKLNRSISETVLLRGGYADDIRRFSRNRKLPMDILIKLLRAKRMKQKKTGGYFSKPEAKKARRTVLTPELRAGISDTSTRIP